MPSASPTCQPVDEAISISRGCRSAAAPAREPISSSASPRSLHLMIRRRRQIDRCVRFEPIATILCRPEPVQRGRRGRDAQSRGPGADRRRPPRPWRTATSSAMTDSAVSAALRAPRSRPTGARSGPDRHRRRRGARAARGARPGRAWTPSRRCRRARRRARGGGSRRRSRVVRQHGEIRGAVDPAEPPQRGLGPLDDHLDGVRQTLAGGEPRARVDDIRAPPADPREVREVTRVRHGAEDEHARRGRGDVDEQLAAQLRGLGPHQLVRRGACPDVERVVAERPLARAVDVYEQPPAGVGAGHRRHQRRPSILASDRGKRGLRAHRASLAAAAGWPLIPGRR